MERRKIIAHHRRNQWISQRGNHDLHLNRQRIVQRNLEVNHLAEIQRHVDHDRPLRNQDDLVQNQDLEDLDLNLGDQNRVRRKSVRSLSEANPNRQDHDHDRDRDRDPRNPVPRVRIEASQENQDPSRVTQDHPSPGRSLRKS